MLSSESSDFRLTFFLSLTAIPSSYIYNNGIAALDASARPLWMMIIAVGILTTVAVIAHLGSIRKDWIYTGMKVFAYTSVIDAMITLEYLGVVENFMSQYLIFGEPYLTSPYGFAVCFFDATFLYSMYLVMVYLYGKRKSWQSVGIYWTASLLSAMCTYMLALPAGRHSVTFCTLLNIPYVVFPICCLISIITNSKPAAWNSTIKRGFFLNVADFAIGIGFVFSVWIIYAKSLALLGSENKLVLYTVEHDTGLRYNDPAPFNTIQAYFLFFYVLPVQLLSIYFLARNEKPQLLWYITLVQAGVMLQAQFVYIVSSFDLHTPSPYRPDVSNIEFWIINLILLIVPHVFLLRLYLHRASNKFVSTSKANNCTAATAQKFMRHSKKK